jgi:hypothetical protein
MYISYQYLIAIENDRLRSLETRCLRQQAGRAARVTRATRRDRGPGRAIIRAFRPRPATGHAL